LKQNISAINEELQKNTQEFDKNKNTSVQEFTRGEIERQVELEQEITDKKKDINKEQKEEEQSLERIKELKEELVALEQEHLDIQGNINSLQA
jgi:hypothetical protein